MSLVPEAMENAELDSDGISAKNIGDFLAVLNDELKWPFAKIAERLIQSGLWPPSSQY
jgi:hypothetical protein